jgi:hypothetical protein
MAAKLKVDLEWDFASYISKVNMVHSKVSGAIKRFSNCLAIIENEDKSESEIKEDLKTIKIEDSLFQSLLVLGENLKNQAFHNSLLISAYSFLEFSLVEYCKLLNDYLSVEKQFNETKGIGILKCRRFLNRELNLNLHLMPNWKFLDDMRELRNLIIHNNSNIITNPTINLEDQEFYERFINYKELEITESGYIFIKDMGLITNLVDTSVEFINEIIEKTKTKIE